MERKAGIESFKKFGYINTVDSLAGGDVLKWNDVLNLPYEMVFLKQLRNKTQEAYSKKYQELVIAANSKK